MIEEVEESCSNRGWCALPFGLGRLEDSHVEGSVEITVSTELMGTLGTEIIGRVREGGSDTVIAAWA